MLECRASCEVCGQPPYVAKVDAPQVVGDGEGGTNATAQHNLPS